jgi:hypothetical protein
MNAASTQLNLVNRGHRLTLGDEHQVVPVHF